MSTTAQAMNDRAAGLSTARVGGIAALAFAVGVALQNGVFLVGTPESGTDLGEAASWYAANRARTMAATAIVGLNIPCILVFAAMLRELGRESAPARRWLNVGMLGAAAMVGVFSIVAAGQIASLLFAEAGATDAFAAVWALHNAAFAVNISVLGTAFLGFALGAHAAGVTSSWQRTAGVVGAALLLVTGLANAFVAEGSPVVFVGFAGFVLWLVWLVTAGIQLVRQPALGNR